MGLDKKPIPPPKRVKEEPASSPKEPADMEADMAEEDSDGETDQQQETRAKDETAAEDKVRNGKMLVSITKSTLAPSISKVLHLYTKIMKRTLRQMTRQRKTNLHLHPRRLRSRKKRQTQQTLKMTRTTVR